MKDRYMLSGWPPASSIPRDPTRSSCATSPGANRKRWGRSTAAMPRWCSTWAYRAWIGPPPKSSSRKCFSPSGAAQAASIRARAVPTLAPAAGALEDPQRVASPRRRPAEDKGDPTRSRSQQSPTRSPAPKSAPGRASTSASCKSALESLPPKQRQAVSMAFLDDMTHEQVASALDVPLGTAKTRIRSGLQILRHAAGADRGVVACPGSGGGRVPLRPEPDRARARRARAQLVTTSDLAPLRLDAALAQGFRPVPTPTTAVESATTSRCSTSRPCPLARRPDYQAWVRHGDRWTSLGTFAPRPDGSARLIAENPALAAPPDALEITAEPRRQPGTHGSSGPGLAEPLEVGDGGHDAFGDDLQGFDGVGGGDGDERVLDAHAGQPAQGVDHWRHVVDVVAGIPHVHRRLFNRRVVAALGLAVRAQHVELARNLGVGNRLHASP